MQLVSGLESIPQFRLEVHLFFSTQLGRFKGGEIRDGAGGSKLDSDIFRCGGFCMKKKTRLYPSCVFTPCFDCKRIHKRFIMSCLFFRVPLGRHRPTWFLIYSGEFISLSILLYFDRCPRACCWYYQFKWCRVCTNESLALFRGSAARGATSGTLVIHGARSQSRRSVESEQPFRRLASFRSKISDLKLKFCVCVCVCAGSQCCSAVGW